MLDYLNKRKEARYWHVANQNDLHCLKFRKTFIFLCFPGGWVEERRFYRRVTCELFPNAKWNKMHRSSNINASSYAPLTIVAVSFLVVLIISDNFSWHLLICSLNQLCVCSCVVVRGRGVEVLPSELSGFFSFTDEECLDSGPILLVCIFCLFQQYNSCVRDIVIISFTPRRHGSIHQLLRTLGSARANVALPSHFSHT